MKFNTKCAICKKPIYRIPSHLNGHNLCSYSCRNKYYSGLKSFAWRGNNYRKYYEHYYNIKIPKGMVIHHKDGNHKNNKIENLVLCTPKEHAKFHYKKSINSVETKCLNCNKKL